MKKVADPATIRILYWVFDAGFMVLTLGHVAIGYGLTHLQAWARWTVVVVTGISLVAGVGLSLLTCLTSPISGLISLVVGVAINGLILYPMLTPRSGVVFSKGYREIIRLTPKIKSRMHWLLKSLIGLMLLAVVGFCGYLYAIYEAGSTARHSTLADPPFDLAKKRRVGLAPRAPPDPIVGLAALDPPYP